MQVDCGEKNGCLSTKIRCCKLLCFRKKIFGFFRHFKYLWRQSRLWVFYLNHLNPIRNSTTNRVTIKVTREEALLRRKIAMRVFEKTLGVEAETLNKSLKMP